jgi:hypothetical protein
MMATLSPIDDSPLSPDDDERAAFQCSAFRFCFIPDLEYVRE